MKFFKKKLSLEERIKNAKYDRIYKTLQEVLSVSELKTLDGKQVVDYEATCSVIKTKVRLAKDFVDELSAPLNDKDKKK